MFSVTPDDRVAQLIGLSFDPILRDVFLPLTRGASLCLPDKTDGLNLIEPLAWLQQARITILHTVPSLAQAWLTTGQVGMTLPDLRYAFFAGEPLTDTLVTQWRALFPRCRVVNFYGPTETTMVKCYHPIPDQVEPGIQAIGRPIPQTQALILADHDRLCGLNEPGEIVLRTPFRTLGYINASSEAQKQFRPNPFRADPTDLLYYTGDLGYYRVDGSVAILGRRDDQVKVHGVRIELGEIIAWLAQHPTVQANTVITKQDKSGQNYLVAYIVPQSGQKINISVLRNYLSNSLIPAMVPAIFVILEQLPLLPTGKVDRRQLPEPKVISHREEDCFIAPDGPIEELLSQIWQTVLKVESISRQDHFLELGGHSLLAIQVISRLYQEYEIELSLQQLFEYPTIAELALVVEDIIMADLDNE